MLFRLSLAVLTIAALAGCIVTGGIEYEDPENPGVKANLGIAREFGKKPKAARPAKTVVPLENERP